AELLRADGVHLSGARRNVVAPTAATPAPRRRSCLPARAPAFVQPQVLPGMATALHLRREDQRPAGRRARVPSRGAAAHAAAPVRAQARRRLAFTYGAACDEEPRPPVGDRTGDGAARLRLLPRGAQAHGSAPRPVFRAA